MFCIGKLAECSEKSESTLLPWLFVVLLGFVRKKKRTKKKKPGVRSEVVYNFISCVLSFSNHL